MERSGIRFALLYDVILFSSDCLAPFCLRRSCTHGCLIGTPASLFQRYVGVTGLASIVRDHPKYAQEHQMAVIDCLEDPDETLKRKTLDLLYTMTNPVNVEFIAEKLLSFLEQGTDSFWRQVGLLILSFSLWVCRL